MGKNKNLKKRNNRKDDDDSDEGENIDDLIEKEMEEQNNYNQELKKQKKQAKKILKKETTQNKMVVEDDENSDLMIERNTKKEGKKNQSENILVSKLQVKNDIEDDDEEDLEEDEEEEEGEIEYENEKETLKELTEKIQSKFNNKFNNDSNQIFMERLTVVADSSVDKKLNINDDIKREVVFYNIAFEGAVKGINKLKVAKQKLNRPDDFMAEMLKSDEQMRRVKKQIMSNEDRIKKFQLREEKMLNKKFNKKVRGKMAKESQEYKKTSKEAIEHWKRSKFYSFYFITLNLLGIKENPNEYYKLDDYVNKPIRNKKSMSRKNRDLKFNPKLAHESKFKQQNKFKHRRGGDDEDRGGRNGRGGKGGRGGRDRGRGGFKGGDKRPGKIQRINNRNKKQSRRVK